jgi:hypothetical protein
MKLKKKKKKSLGTMAEQYFRDQEKRELTGCVAAIHDIPKSGATVR